MKVLYEAKMKALYNEKIKGLKKEKAALLKRMKLVVSYTKDPYIKAINKLDRKIGSIITDKKTLIVKSKKPRNN